MRKDDYLLLGSTTVAALALGLAAWGASTFIKSEYDQRVTAALQAVLVTGQQGISAWVESGEQEAAAWSMSPETIRQVEALLELPADGSILRSAPEQASILRHFEPFLMRGERASFAVFDRSGLARAANDPRVVGHSLSGTGPLAARLDSIWTGLATAVVTPFHAHTPGPEGFVPHTDVVAAIGRKGTDAIAVLSLSLNPPMGFGEVLKAGRMGDTGEAFLFDSEGRVLNQSRIPMEDLSAEGALKEGAIYLLDPGVDLTAGQHGGIPASERTPTKMVLSALSGTDGVSLTPYRSFRGVRVIGAWTWDEHLGIGVGIEVDEAEAFSTLWTVTRSIYALAAIAVALLLVLAATVSLSRARKRERSALLESEALFRNLFSGIAHPTSLWRKVGDDFVLTALNRTARESLGVGAAELIGTTIDDFWGDVTELVDGVSKCYATRRVVKMEIPYRTRSTGADAIVDFRLSFVDPGYILVHGDDVTERRELENELARTLEALRGKSRELQQLQELEWGRLSSDILDGLGAGLFALRAHLGSDDDTDQLSSLVDELFSRVHHASNALRPVELEQFGLEAALEELVLRTRKVAGPDVDYRIEWQGEDRVEPEVESAAYRIAVEAITNAQRHADASLVTLEVHRDSRSVVVQVMDDGRGFDTVARKDDAVGLRRMKRRAEVLGGSITLTSSPDSGTIVRALLPAVRSPAEFDPAS